MSNENKSNTGGGFLGWVFVILLALKLWGTNVFGYNLTQEISWWAVAMPFMMGIWAGLTRPSSQ